MNTGVVRAWIGQWYLRWDKGEIFQVTGFDPQSMAVEVQTFDGDLDEIDQETWSTLPLGLAEPPEDWTGPVDDVEIDDLGYSDTEMRPQDWGTSLRQFGGAEPSREAWEDTSDAEEPDQDGEVVPEEVFIAEVPATRERLF
jgi:hypothetical protein